MATLLPRDTASALCAAYLRTLYDDPDLAAHHRLHDEDAHLILGAGVVRARDIAPAAYARSLHDLLRGAGLDLDGLRRRRPAFTLAGVTDMLPGPSLPGDECVAVAVVRERGDGSEHRAAFGVAHGRVRWVTLLPDGAQPPLIDRLQAQAHGELAYVPLTGQPLLLSALELSHYRLHRLPGAALSFLPEARFTCHMSGNCCRNDWVIHLSANERAAIDARDYRRRLPLLGSEPLHKPAPAALRAEGDPRPYALGHGAGRRCVFLTGDQRCLVHAEAGMAIYQDCQVFPYGFTFTPDGVAVWSLLFCPSARQGRGRSFADNEADIRGRLQRVPGSAPGEFVRRPGEPIPWAAFRAAEEVLLRYLGAGAPPRQGLLAALRWLERWDGAPPGSPPAYDPALLDTPLLPLVAPEREVADAVFAMMTQNPYLRPLSAPPPEAAAPAGDRPDAGLAAAPFIPYLLRTLVFSKSLSFRYGVVTGFNYTVLAYALLARRVAGWRVDAVPEDEWGGFFASLQHAHYHRLLALVQEHALLRGLSASPLFGELLLRAAVLSGGAALSLRPPHPAKPGEPPPAVC